MIGTQIRQYSFLAQQQRPKVSPPLPGRPQRPGNFFVHGNKPINLQSIQLCNRYYIQDGLSASSRRSKCSESVGRAERRDDSCGIWLSLPCLCKGESSEYWKAA